MPEKSQFVEALERIVYQFQGDWPRVAVVLQFDDNICHLRLAVDDEMRDAIVHARKLLEEDTKCTSSA